MVACGEASWLEQVVVLNSTIFIERRGEIKREEEGAMRERERAR